ncbi:NADP-dependent oxidoreductase domain-containing protein [Aspergillus arachidicola]|uniref:NADP-dependent oxidoreductase domain-containing protein n=1 Tax=Aspergillus arachidicola TaxID=656916 RepID=A0A5N6XPL7_9EURO|nr:NADP-dependent oxidoreductase domain-containing protein [Aspergillus arachidicola]
MTIGPDAALGARITDLGKYRKCLDYLTSKGYNELDTAAIYAGGKQETFTNDVGFKYRGYRIASKTMPKEPHDHAPERLPATSSNYASWEVAEIVGICERRGFLKPAIYQGIVQSRALESKLEPCLRKFGISLVIYNPPAAGPFSGKYSTLEEPAEGRFSTSNPLGKLYMERYYKQSNMAALAILEPVAKKHGIPLFEVALRRCLRKKKEPLPDEVVEALDKAWARTRGDAPTYWRRCIFFYIYYSFGHRLSFPPS